MVRQHVSPEELQACVLDAEPLSPTSRQHLDDCPDCQREMADSQRVVTCLVSRLYRSQCPSAATLSYYCLPNALSAEEQHQVTNHLAHCPLCLAEFADTRQFLNSAI
jgi:anti-sigma factor RsiW